MFPLEFELEGKLKSFIISKLLKSEGKQLNLLWFWFINFLFLDITSLLCLLLNEFIKVFFHFKFEFFIFKCHINITIAKGRRSYKKKIFPQLKWPVRTFQFYLFLNCSGQIWLWWGMAPKWFSRVIFCYLVWLEITWHYYDHRCLFGLN